MLCRFRKWSRVLLSLTHHEIEDEEPEVAPRLADLKCLEWKAHEQHRRDRPGRVLEFAAPPPDLQQRIAEDRAENGDADEPVLHDEPHRLAVDAHGDRVVTRVRIPLAATEDEVDG